MGKNRMFRKMLATLLVVTIALTALPLTAFAASRAPSGVDPTKYLNDTFFIKNKNSGKYLDIKGGKPTNGSNLVQWSFSGNKNQQWKLKKQSNGTYKIVSALSGGPSIDIAGKSNKNGANAQIWKSSQTFKVKNTSGNYYKIESTVSGKSYKVLSVDGKSKKNGANVVQWSFGGGGNDQWQFERVVSASKGISPKVQNTMDRYEQWADDYLALAIAFDKTDEDDEDAFDAWLDNYLNLMVQLDDVAEQTDQLLQNDLSNVEFAYYRVAMIRIDRKLDRAYDLLPDDLPYLMVE